MDEARLRETGEGLAPGGEGWSTVNARDAARGHCDALGLGCVFEGRRESAGVGYALCELRPGQPGAVSHREAEQEDLLVPAGE